MTGATFSALRSYLGALLTITQSQHRAAACRDDVGWLDALAPSRHAAPRSLAPGQCPARGDPGPRHPVNCCCRDAYLNLPFRWRSQPLGTMFISR